MSALKRNAAGVVICGGHEPKPRPKSAPASRKTPTIPTHLVFRQSAMFRNAGRAWL